MGKLLYSDPQAEQEANDIAFQFMDSRDVMGDMGRAYHTDFSSVSIHTDESAAEKTAEAGVDAFASGKDIFFGRDAFDQSDPASRGLLAHELVHTMQQDAGAESVQSAAPAGAEQGGILDWFRSRFGKKKKNEDIEISEPRDGHRQEGTAAQQYREAMAPVFAADLINRTATPEAHIGQGGGAGTGEAFASALQGVYMDASNRTFHRGDRSNALVNLGLRNSGEAPSLTEKAMRGDIYEGLGQDYADWMFKLQENGLDMAGILKNGESGTKSKAKMKDGSEDKFVYATGGGYDALSNKALDMFSQYVLSDQSVDYVKKFSKGVGSADVFGGQMYGTEGASGYALHTLANTVGGNVTQAALDKRLGGESKRVAVQVGRMMGALPVLVQLADEEIPKALIPLRDRYLQLQAELDRRLQETG